MKGDALDSSAPFIKQEQEKEPGISHRSVFHSFNNHYFSPFFCLFFLL